MKLNEDLQNYLAQSNGKNKSSSASKSSDGGLLTFWNNSNNQSQGSVSLSFEGESAASSLEGNKEPTGWFKSIKIPLLGGQPSENVQQSRISRLCACFPTLVSIFLTSIIAK